MHRVTMSTMLSFFFFQAEDGIRDLTVTGVQTCALPIWVSGRSLLAGFATLFMLLLSVAAVTPAALRVLARAAARLGARVSLVARLARSEERRVGKEGRSRGSPHH